MEPPHEPRWTAWIGGPSRSILSRGVKQAEEEAAADAMLESIERTDRLVTSVARIVTGGVAISAALLAISYYLNTRSKANAERVRLERKTRGRCAAAQLRLNQWEESFVERVIDPDDIDVAFKDIGGLARVKRELYEIAVLPMTQPGLFTGRGNLLRPPKGILLYGAPGTGKTMLAKALAKESAACFLAVNASDLMSKYILRAQCHILLQIIRMLAQG